MYKSYLFLCLDDDESVGYWTTLMDADVSHKTLMALIYCLLERTKQVSKISKHCGCLLLSHLPTHIQRPLDRICAVHAAQLYLLLLQLPGSGAFKIFHSMIFQRMLDTFHLFHDEGEERVLCVWGEMYPDDPLPSNGV